MRMQANTWYKDLKNFNKSLSLRFAEKDSSISESDLLSFQQKYSLFLEYLIEQEKVNSLSRFDKFKSRFHLNKLIKIITLFFPYLGSRIRGIKVKNNQLSPFSKLKLSNHSYRFIVLFLQ